MSKDVYCAREGEECPATEFATFGDTLIHMVDPEWHTVFDGRNVRVENGEVVFEKIDIAPAAAPPPAYGQDYPSAG